MDSSANIENSADEVVVSASSSEMKITEINTSELCDRVKHYLKFNQINWERFAKLLLGISQSRLSTLLNHPRPFHLLSKRVQALYERMQLWMDTKATYGNNPYAKDKSLRRKQKQKRAYVRKRVRSLIDSPDDEKIKEESAKEPEEKSGETSHLIGVPKYVNINPDDVNITDVPIEEVIGVDDILKSEAATEETVPVVEDFQVIYMEEGGVPIEDDSDIYEKDSSFFGYECDDCGKRLADDRSLVSNHILCDHFMLEEQCDLCDETTDDIVQHFWAMHVKKVNAENVEDSGYSENLSGEVDDDSLDKEECEFAISAAKGMYMNPFYVKSAHVADD